ncbi:enhanced intracellular survival protein Eis [Microbispora sp. KK1-11]|uniref:GNAT family N-acetyltransferase n=1 Tax=Microbispora sp. KK1-11 TaxID=2053005 RepID=UPI0011591E11|nr:GNAT family N-acetyltransferase [Microbispora sp. KK1-11]TQS26561.1 GNAT family N-acetyltransferase [Microbispora sp. KK1-11]
MEIRHLTSDDLDAVLDNRRRAFGPLSGGGAETWRKLVSPMLPEGRYLGAFDGPRLVGTARINPYVQWWHGRPLSMGGVAGVTVSPEDRGRGVGRALTHAAIERCAELGHAVSALYPATTPVYRSAGYEHAGVLQRITVPTEALRTLGGGAAGTVKLRRMGPADAAELVALIGRVHAATRASGPLCFDERTWRLWLEDDDDFCYLAEDGFVVYRWSDGDIEVDNLLAGSEATSRALWSLVGSASTVAKSVTACVDPADPVLWMLRERSKDEVTQTRWMFRLIDLPAAVEGRGFPAGVRVETPVEVTDSLRPGNAGTWVLRVDGGAGSVTRPGGPAAEATRLTIGGMSALFAGVPTATLRRAGLLSGGSPDADDALDAAFGCGAYMIDYF